jgi:hypothetical protein
MLFASGRARCGGCAECRRHEMARSVDRGGMPGSHLTERVFTSAMNSCGNS